MRQAFILWALAVLVFTTRLEAGFIDISGGDLTGGAPSIGQTFTVPVGDTFFVSYTLQLVNFSSFPIVSQVYAWNGDAVTGPPLYTSSLFYGSGVFGIYEFFPSIAVTPGAQYISLITNSPGGEFLGSPPDASTGWQIFMKQGNPYSGGQIEFKAGNPEVGNWSSTIANADAVFHAEFSTAAVPEPSSAVMFMFGIAMTTAFRFRRSR